MPYSVIVEHGVTPDQTTKVHAARRVSLTMDVVRLSFDLAQKAEVRAVEVRYGRATLAFRKADDDASMYGDNGPLYETHMDVGGSECSVLMCPGPRTSLASTSRYPSGLCKDHGLAHGGLARTLVM